MDPAFGQDRFISISTLSGQFGQEVHTHFTEALTPMSNPTGYVKWSWIKPLMEKREVISCNVMRPCFGGHRRKGGQ